MNKVSDKYTPNIDTRLRGSNAKVVCYGRQTNNVMVWGTVNTSIDGKEHKIYLVYSCKTYQKRLKNMTELHPIGFKDKDVILVDS